MAIIGIVSGIGRTFGEKVLNSLRNGLWPHGPEQHLKHRWCFIWGVNLKGEKQPRRFARYQYGLYTHHHEHPGHEFDKDNDRKIYHPMRCYKGIVQIIILILSQ